MDSRREPPFFGTKAGFYGVFKLLPLRGTKAQPRALH